LSKRRCQACNFDFWWNRDLGWGSVLTGEESEMHFGQIPVIVILVSAVTSLNRAGVTGQRRARMELRHQKPRKLAETGNAQDLSTVRANAPSHNNDSQSNTCLSARHLAG
jgi:hypothetical protein